MQMNKWIRRIIITLVLAIIIHFIALMAIPNIVGSAIKGILLEKGKHPINTLYHIGMRTMEDKRVRMDNPDTSTSRLVYDVSKKPLRISLTVPEPSTLPYWSFALYARNMVNFYVLNDKTAKSKYNSTQVELLLIGPNSNYKKTADEIVIRSPNNIGFGIIRTVVPDRYSAEGMKQADEILKLQRRSTAVQVN
jgi:uncharacterized membrane protein